MDRLSCLPKANSDNYLGKIIMRVSIYLKKDKILRGVRKSFKLRRG
jgi:hypothetical protein